ncbi:MAG: hypothetical protein Phyf2KO_03310 [Phycisphaerales bacterium]
MKPVTAFLTCGVVAFNAQADYLEFCFTVSLDGRWHLNAELMNPEGVVLAAVADLGLTIGGVNFSNVEYNPAFDSDFFGDADLTVTGTSIDFLGGNTLPPLDNAGGTDSSNPLHIMSFDADSVESVSLVGQVTGAYTGSPFPTILTYQDAQGNAGDTPYKFCIPAPGSALLLGLACTVTVRRRRLE